MTFKRGDRVRLKYTNGSLVAGMVGTVTYDAYAHEGRVHVLWEAHPKVYAEDFGYVCATFALELLPTQYTIGHDSAMYLGMGE